MPLSNLPNRKIIRLSGFDYSQKGGYFVTICCQDREHYFYNDCLKWLFYDGLNKNNSDIYDFNSYFNQKVPYLKGGFFKED